MTDARKSDPAAEHTAGARRAVETNDMGSLLRHIVGWILAVTRRAPE